jgi:YYY domain-containing protein
MRETFEALFWWLSQPDAVLWWATVILIGLAAFPLAFRFFSSLPDRGYAFAKVFGLVILAYTLWIGGYVHILPFRQATIIVLLLLMASASVAAVWRGRPEFIAYLRDKWSYMLVVEGLFTISFAVAVYLRSFVAEISIPEKTADFAFINGILRSDFFPPQDPWMSGNSIAWYYFGHLNMATLTKLTAIPSRITFNLSIALVVSLAATGVFGIVYNLLATRLRWRAIVFGLVGVIFLLLLSNIVGVVELLSANGFGSDGFYRMLDIYDINGVVESPKWYPTEWWWIARSVQIASPWDGREFPFFTFLQGDLHAHMMVIPFDFLALAAILDLWRSDCAIDLGERGRRDARLHSGLISVLTLEVPRAVVAGFQFWRGHPLRLAVTALAVGASGFVELWALPALLLLLLAVPIGKSYLREGRLTLEGAAGALAFGLPPTVLAVLAFSPFYVGLRSVSDGIQPIEVLHRGFLTVDATITRPHHFIYQWLTHVWLLLSFLLVALGLVVRRALAADGGEAGVWRRRLLSVATAAWPALAPLSLWAFLVLVKRGPLGLADEVVHRDASWITLLILGALLTLAVLAYRWHAQRSEESEERQSLLFAIKMAGAALLMLFGIELFWVQDPFGARFNTVFRLGFQAWILLSVAIAYGLYFVLSQWRVDVRSALVNKGVWAGVTLVIIAAALVYPVPATVWRTDEFAKSQTLDGLAYVKAYNVDGYQAFIWLGENVPTDAVVLEAVGEDYNAGRGQVSAATGLQTVLGWPWHECRWRAFGTCRDPLAERPLAERNESVEKIYTTPDLSEAAALLQRYDVDYVYVGPAERDAYGDGGLSKFERFFESVYTSDTVTIYHVPDDLQSRVSAQ